MALEAMGAICNVEKVETPLGPVYETDPERHARYLEARELQQPLYNSLIEADTADWL